MNQAKYYFRNGCTNCDGGEVAYHAETFIYKCKDCGAYAHAHRENTEYSKTHEPSQYLADNHINNLRKKLTEQINYIWRNRVIIHRRGKEHPEAIINIIFRKNIRMLNNTFVHVIHNDKSLNKTTVYCYADGSIIEEVNYLTLSPVNNRNKTHLWLSEQLALPFEQCKIGYLSENDLKSAIQLCSKNIDYALQQSIRSSTGAT